MKYWRQRFEQRKEEVMSQGTKAAFREKEEWILPGASGKNQP